ncbi:MAG: alpha/beta fold hydrolase [Pseudomonadota bacterium]
MLSYLTACGALVFALLPGAALAAPAERPPAEHFFENPAFSGAALSPSAKYLAIQISKSGKRDTLAVFDLIAGSAAVVAGFPDTDIGDFMWVNDNRLVFDTVDKRLTRSVTERAPGLYAINRDGKELRQLVARHGEGTGRVLAYNNYLIANKGPQESDFVYVWSPTFDGYDDYKNVNLRRVNAVNGESTTINRPPNTQHWVFDHKGEPRIAIAHDKNLTTIHYRDPATSAWSVLTSFKRFGSGGGEEFTPLAFGPDGTLYVETNAGKDKSAVHTYNFKTGKVNPEALIVTKDYDFAGSFISNKDKLLGVRVTTDADTTVWFDPKMKELQVAVDALLPNTNNLISVAARPETNWVLVTAYSDLQPAMSLIYDTVAKTLRKVGDSYPNIRPEQMGPQTLVRYKARDGLEIPAWLTLPANGKKDLPMVVLVHGGPFMRGDSWGWNPEYQFLASRGYAVLVPEFRGSTGYGDKHYEAGKKQWGLAMQDDIADGAKWAIAQGIADPKRICIAGASYGGYATLMGLINDPALYKCGIDWVGVTDINLMYDGSWIFDNDMSSNYKKYGMPDMVGDQVKDAAQLKATSPLEQAARITQPLLLAYGGEDLRVPAYHGQKFYKAVKQTNPNVEWVLYPDEGHGWHLPKTRIDFWTRVEKFLDRNIGK